MFDASRVKFPRALWTCVMLQALHTVYQCLCERVAIICAASSDLFAAQFCACTHTAMDTEVCESQPSPAAESDCGEDTGADDADARLVKATEGRATETSNKRTKQPKSGAKPKLTKQDKAPRGTKWCRGCGKYLPDADFPVGKSLCGADQRAMRNMRARAASEGLVEWFEERRDDPKKLSAMLTR